MQEQIFDMTIFNLGTVFLHSKMFNLGTIIVIDAQYTIICNISFICAVCTVLTISCQKAMQLSALFLLSYSLWKD